MTDVLALDAAFRDLVFKIEMSITMGVVTHREWSTTQDLFAALIRAYRALGYSDNDIDESLMDIGLKESNSPPPPKRHQFRT